jgi:hypothetical protein
MWTAKYDGAMLSDDKPVDLKTDNNGNVYVTGYSSESNKDLITLKLDNSGKILWKKISTVLKIPVMKLYA